MNGCMFPAYGLDHGPIVVSFTKAAHKSTQGLSRLWMARRGAVQNGAAIVRPPGHHAEGGMAMGFCYFNNAGLAARAAQAAGARRVLVLDWDVHHGNGTQHIFEHDPGVMYMSIHRYDGCAAHHLPPQHACTTLTHALLELLDSQILILEWTQINVRCIHSKGHSASSAANLPPVAFVSFVELSPLGGML